MTSGVARVEFLGGKQGRTREGARDKIGGIVKGPSWKTAVSSGQD